VLDLQNLRRVRGGGEVRRLRTSGLAPRFNNKRAIFSSPALLQIADFSNTLCEELMITHQKERIR